MKKLAFLLIAFMIPFIANSQNKRIDGFMDYKWMMSKKQVLDIDKADNWIRFRKVEKVKYADQQTEVMEFDDGNFFTTKPKAVTMTFVDDKLVSVKFYLDCIVDLLATDEYNELKRKISSKYGGPTEDDRWSTFPSSIKSTWVQNDDKYTSSIEVWMLSDAQIIITYNYKLIEIKSGNKFNPF